MSYSKLVPAAERTLNILEALAKAPDGLTASELLMQLDIPRSALFALLNTLKTRDYVSQQDHRGTYFLGSALWNLTPGAADKRMSALIQEFQADIEMGDMLETAVLSRLEGTHSVIISQRKGPGRVQVVFQLGERRDVTAVSDGRVLLAGLSPAHLSKIAPDLPASTSEKLQQIRMSGVAQTNTPDTIEIACPICADGMKPIASLMVCVLRFDVRVANLGDLTKQVQQAAARLSYRIGAPVYQPYGWAQGDSVGPIQPLSSTELSQFLQEPWGQD